jgi:hypothetical protein
MGPLVRRSGYVVVFAGEAWLPVWHGWPTVMFGTDSWFRRSRPSDGSGVVGLGSS